MTSLYLSLLVLAAVCLILLAIPLFKTISHSRQRFDEDAKANQLAIYNEQKDIFKQQQLAGQLSESDYQQLVEELKLKLLSDAELSAETIAQTKEYTFNKVASPSIVISSILLIVFGITTYYYIGSPQLVTRLIDIEQVAQSEEQLTNFSKLAFEQQSEQKITDLILLHQQQILDERENLEHWTKLAQLYIQIGQNELAIGVLSEALKYNPNELPIKIALADALMRSQTPDNINRAQQQLMEVLTVSPEHQGAIMMLAFSYFNQQQYAKAIELWQNLRAQLATGSDSYKLLTNTIETARTRQASLAEQQQGDVNWQLTVSLSIDPSILSALSPDARVFIFARPINSRMPLAVKAYSLTELPKQISLTNADSMIATNNLSMHKTIEVSAKISIEGSATPDDTDIIAMPIKVSYDQYQASDILKLEFTSLSAK